MSNKPKEPVRVLEVCQRMEAAGVQSFLMNMYRNIDRDKVQMDFLVHYKEHQFFDDEIERMGGRIYRFSVREDYNLIKYWRELKRFFIEHPEYHIIHGHMDTLGAFYLKCAKRGGVQVRIAHAHNDSVQKGIKRPFRLIMIRLYKKYANYLMACSENASRFMFGNSQCMIINNAIDTRKYGYNLEIRAKKRKELGIVDEFVIGNVGRFHVQKNQIFLIDIMKELISINPNVKLFLIGSGEMENEIRSKIEKGELSKYISILKNRADVNELYQAMDMFILPSLYEGLPVSGIEAQTAGLPCVFSSEITLKADITGNVTFISLEENAKKWANEIQKIYKGFLRKNVNEKIKKAGYDANLEAKKLQEIYIKMHNIQGE